MMPIRPEMRAEYPPKWREISLRIRGQRAGDRCECRGECGHDHGAERELHDREFEAAWGMKDPTPTPDRCLALNTGLHPVTGSTVVLTVAHLDHHPPNAMCQRCYLAYDKEHHKQTRRKRLVVRDLFETEEI